MDIEICFVPLNMRLVQCLMAKYFVVRHSPLEALPVVQT